MFLAYVYTRKAFQNLFFLLLYYFCFTNWAVIFLLCQNMHRIWDQKLMSLGCIFVIKGRRIPDFLVPNSYIMSFSVGHFLNKSKWIIFGTRCSIFSIAVVITERCVPILYSQHELWKAPSCLILGTYLNFLVSFHPLSTAKAPGKWSTI